LFAIDIVVVVVIVVVVECRRRGFEHTRVRYYFLFCVLALVFVLRDVCQIFVFLWFSAAGICHLCGGERRATVKKKN
jgi:hypothetical protein